VQAEIAVGEELAAVLENADFVVADEHDAAVAIGELGGLGYELLGHGFSVPFLKRYVLPGSARLAGGFGRI
jgi:hypothetical protein